MKTATLDKVEKEALGLSREERAFLANRLLSSLGDEALGDVDAAWVAEAEHNDVLKETEQRFVSGLEQPVDWTTAKQKLRKRFE